MTRGKGRGGGTDRHRRQEHWHFCDVRGRACVKEQSRRRWEGNGEDENEAKKVAERSWSREGVRERTPQVQRTDEEERAREPSGISRRRMPSAQSTPQGRCSPLSLT